MWLVAINDIGCGDTAFHSLTIDQKVDPKFPNVFTPDGDGLNDTWGPMGQSFEYESYNAKVFDRWGKLIWQTDNPYKYWDGNFMGSGEEVKQGMYVYTFELKKFNTFEPKIITGTVTLYRHN